MICRREPGRSQRRMACDIECLILRGSPSPVDRDETRGSKSKERNFHQVLPKERSVAIGKRPNELLFEKI